jgi:uncharacterized membrane protein
MKYALIFTILIAVSCGKVNVDNTDPQIELLTFNGQSAINELNTGDAFNIQMRITDNDELYEVLVKIENTTDASLPVSKKIIIFERFTELNSKVFERVLEVPTDSNNVSGDYEIQVQVVDRNGNANSSFSSFRLFNPGQQAVVNIDSYTPAPVDNVIQIAKGDSILIVGNITDNTGIFQIKLSLTGQGTIHQQTIDLTEPDFVWWNFEWLPNTIIIPASASAGNYELRMHITDMDGNATFFSQPVLVTE